MRKFVVAALAVALAGIAMPGAEASAAPRTASAVNRDIGLIAAWAAQINGAMEPANVAMAAAQPKLEVIWAKAHDRASARAAAAEALELLRAQRSQIAGAQSALAAIPDAPPDGARASGIDVKVLLTDARTLVAHLLDYNDTMIKFAAAVDSGDMDAVRTGIPMVVRGGLLILDGQATTYRNRQALFPSDQPAHQVAGVTAALYTATSIATRASFRAILDHQPAEAAADERAGLTDLAGKIAVNTRAGRQNLARMKTEMAQELGRASAGDAARIAAKMKIVADAEENMFLAADDLEKWARTEAQENDAVRAEHGKSEAMHKIIAIERRLIAIQTAAAAAVAATQ